MEQKNIIGLKSLIILTLAVAQSWLVSCSSSKNMTCGHTMGCAVLECSVSQMCSQKSTPVPRSLFVQQGNGKQQCTGTCKNLTCQANQGACAISRGSTKTIMLCDSTECSQEAKGSIIMRSSAPVTKQECTDSISIIGRRGSPPCSEMLCREGNECEMKCQQQICEKMNCNSKDCKFTITGKEYFTSYYFGEAKDIKCGATTTRCNLVSRLALSKMTCNATSCTHDCDDLSACNVLSVRHSKQYLKNCDMISSLRWNCECAKQKSCVQECKKGGRLQVNHCSSLKCMASDNCHQLAWSDTRLIEATSRNASQVCGSGKTCDKMNCHSGQSCTMKCSKGANCKSMICNNTACSFTCESGGKCPNVQCGSNTKDCKLHCNSKASSCKLSCDGSTTSCSVEEFKDPSSEAANNVAIKLLLSGMLSMVLFQIELC